MITESGIPAVFRSARVPGVVSNLEGDDFILATIISASQTSLDHLKYFFICELSGKRRLGLKLDRILNDASSGLQL